MAQWTGGSRWFSEHTVLLVRDVWKYSIAVRIPAPISGLQQFCLTSLLHTCLQGLYREQLCLWRWTMVTNYKKSCVLRYHTAQVSNFGNFLRSRQHWLLNLACSDKVSCNGPECIFHQSLFYVHLIFRKCGLCFSISRSILYSVIRYLF